MEDGQNELVMVCCSQAIVPLEVRYGRLEGHSWNEGRAPFEAGRHRENLPAVVLTMVESLRRERESRQIFGSSLLKNEAEVIGLWKACRSGTTS